MGEVGQKAWKGILEMTKQTVVLIQQEALLEAER